LNAHFFPKSDTNKQKKNDEIEIGKENPKFKVKCLLNYREYFKCVKTVETGVKIGFPVFLFHYSTSHSGMEKKGESMDLVLLSRGLLVINFEYLDFLV
jgi:hypothetical protein